MCEPATVASAPAEEFTDSARRTEVERLNRQHVRDNADSDR